MPGLMIIAHAPLASALREVAAHVFPERLDSLAVLDVPADIEPDQLREQATTLLRRVACPQALILTDVFGATPCNVAQQLADGVEIRLVTGVNVPMLWRVLSNPGDAVDSLVARAVAGGSQGVMQVAVQRPQNQPINSRLHDQNYAHHQQ
jgi:mannose PTS system EIIA component